MRASPRTCLGGHVLPGILFALVTALAPALARAGNVGLPRTPVIHRGEACLTRVDRSAQPVVHLDYTIPSIDICLSPDEPADSRTHQFVAFCRDAPVTATVPHWLTWADVQANVDSGYLDPDAVASKDVLEDSATFAGCWRPILGAGERRPITCEAARPGVDWDTRELAPGPWHVAGYTYEPILNQWTWRRGVFRVHDGDPDAAPPAAAIVTPEVTVWKDQPVHLAACVDAAPGATVRADFAVAPDEPDVALTWLPVLPATPAEPGDLELEFVPAPEYAGARLTARIVVEDPQGRTAVAHMPGTILVLTVVDPTGSGGDGGSEGDDFDFCRDNPKADELPTCAAAPAPDPEDGCACSSAPGPAAALLGPLLVVAFAPRRRQRASRSSHAEVSRIMSSKPGATKRHGCRSDGE